MFRQNATSARQKLVLQAEKSKAEAHKPLMKYVERHRPSMILYENVDAMDDANLCFVHINSFLVMAENSSHAQARL